MPTHSNGKPANSKNATATSIRPATPDRATTKWRSDRRSHPWLYTIHTQSSQIIEHNAGTVIGLQNSYATNPEVRGAIADLQGLLIQLQTQHPQITTEAEALPIIDAEFTEIKQSPTSKLATLRQQILNRSAIPKPSKLLWVKWRSTTWKTAYGQKRP